MEVGAGYYGCAHFAVRTDTGALITPGVESADALARRQNEGRLSEATACSWLLLEAGVTSGADEGRSYVAPRLSVGVREPLFAQQTLD